MKKKLQITGMIAITTIVLSLLISACGAAAPATPTTDPGAVYTMAAATVQAQLTEAALANPTAVPPTNTPEPSATPQPAPTLEPTQPLAVQPTALFGGAPLPTVASNLNPNLAPTLSSAAAAGYKVGDYAKFQYNNPADGTLFNPGIRFMGEVGFLNEGSVTWTTEYKLVYTGGAQFSGITSIPLAKAVKPGEKAIFNIAFTAPGELNTANDPWYMSYWKLVNQTGLPVIGGDMYFKIKVIKE